jgi:hypothetical protein
MQLAARLGDVAAGPQDSLAVARAEADLTLEDDRILVLPGVEVGRNEGTDGERVLDDRERSPGVLRQQLEHHTDPGGEATGAAGARLHDGELGGV